MTARSYVPTDKLIALRSTDAELAEQIEKLCRAVQALRGFAIVMQAESTLTFAASATEPFVTPAEVFDEMLRARGAARLPAELKPEEHEEYRRLNRFLASSKAVQRIVSKRQGA